jgi:hypothetical protein
MKPKRPTQRDPSKVAFSVALPRSLVAQIEEYAADQSRSRNGQIEYFLKEAVAKWQREHAKADSVVAPQAAGFEVKPPDPLGDALKVRAGQTKAPPTAPAAKPPARSKDKA